MPSTAYCQVADLLVGNVPLPAYLDPQKFVDDAGDEIDTKIGYLYTTPVDLTAPALHRTAKLLLKRINSHLASGRLLLSVAAPKEQDRLHAYAYSLVKEAGEALECIASGEYPLEGAVPADGAEVLTTPQAMISNLDTESNVEAFYNRIVNPDYVYASADRAYVSHG